MWLVSSLVRSRLCRNVSDFWWIYRTLRVQQRWWTWDSDASSTWSITSLTILTPTISECSTHASLPKTVGCNLSNSRASWSLLGLRLHPHATKWWYFHMINRWTNFSLVETHCYTRCRNSALKSKSMTFNCSSAFNITRNYMRSYRLIWQTKETSLTVTSLESACEKLTKFIFNAVVKQLKTIWSD